MANAAQLLADRLYSEAFIEEINGDCDFDRGRAVQLIQSALADLLEKAHMVTQCSDGGACFDCVQELAVALEPWKISGDNSRAGE